MGTRRCAAGRWRRIADPLRAMGADVERDAGRHRTAASRADTGGSAA